MRYTPTRRLFVWKLPRSEDFYIGTLTLTLAKSTNLLDFEPILQEFALDWDAAFMKWRPRAIWDEERDAKARFQAALDRHVARNTPLRLPPTNTKLDNPSLEDLDL